MVHIAEHQKVFSVARCHGNMPGSTSFIRGLDANQFLMHSSRVAPVATTQRTFRPAR
jgi:hypothetical protein